MWGPAWPNLKNCLFLFGRLYALSLQACLQNKMPVRCGVFPAQAAKPPLCHGIFYFAAQGFSLNRWRSHNFNFFITPHILNAASI
jgi:hypothetical protein